MKNESQGFSLLGFRTNTWWKKILSILYLCVCALIALGSIFEEKFENITTKDFVIDKLYYIVFLLAMLSPYIFLSNTRFRDKIPLFNKHTKSASVVGMIIVIFVFALLCGVVDSLHSEEYKADMENHAYKKTVVTEATCETDGEIDCHCEYCGLYTTETIKATGHKMVQVSADEDKIVNKCEVCGEEKTEVLEKQSTTETTTIKSETNTQKPVTTTEPEEVITFEEIYTDYQRNELAADDKYKGNRYKITGTIQTVNDGGLNGLFGELSVTVIAYANGTQCFLWCTFDEETQRDALTKVSMGDTITFEGTCESWGNWHDCEIVE
ncbi:MAG: hypothetical protein IJZ16_07060 [Clostridia bacterium]|nr:hypothetical protein [Clostridia bacterium]